MPVPELMTIHPTAVETFHSDLKVSNYDDGARGKVKEITKVTRIHLPGNMYAYIKVYRWSKLLSKTFKYCPSCHCLIVHVCLTDVSVCSQCHRG